MNRYLQLRLARLVIMICDNGIDESPKGFYLYYNPLEAARFLHLKGSKRRIKKQAVKLVNNFIGKAMKEHCNNLNTETAS